MNCEVLQSTSCFGTSMTAYGFCIMFGQHSYACVRVVFFHWYNFYSDRILFFSSFECFLCIFCCIAIAFYLVDLVQKSMRVCIRIWDRFRWTENTDESPHLCVFVCEKKIILRWVKNECVGWMKKKRSGDYSSWYACLERNSVIDMENHHIWL